VEQRHWNLSVLVTCFGALVLVFVVLYPYTPTPLSLSIEKMLVAVVVLHACILFTRILEFARTSFTFENDPAGAYSAGEFRALICVRLQ
jgi:hypothetical protein